nr:unnamed protein product [Callosobruchus analis]
MWLPYLWLVVKDRKRIYSPLPQQHWVKHSCSFREPIHLDNNQ